MINIYDFDDTVFDGDSTARFCAYALKRKPSLTLQLPKIAWAFLRYFLKTCTKTEAKQALYRSLLQNVDARKLLEDFWKENLPRVKAWYRAQSSATDIVISASPEFLLKPACEALGVGKLIASRVDISTGDTAGANCHGEEKVRRYLAECEREPFAFYSDSLSDTPMAKLAEKAYMVKGDVISPWPI